MGETLTAGRELDALVAEKVMGWERNYWSGGERVWGLFHPRRSFAACAEFGPPAYSTDIAAAWEVVEQMRAGEDGYDFELTFENGLWGCWFPHQALDAGHAVADTAPLAICRAALAALTPDTTPRVEGDIDDE